MRLKSLFLALAVVLVYACGPKPASNSSISNSKSDRSDIGMVAAAQPLATEAGRRILAKGGNAADAAIATGFAIAVVEHTMNGIGGRSVMTVRTPEGEIFTYNGMTEIPASFSPPEKPVANGYGTIATPGVVANLMRLHQEHGSLPWADLMETAIELADDGFDMLPGEAQRHASAIKAMQNNPGLSQELLKADGTTFKAGEKITQKTLAKTLKRLAKTEGKDFYEGQTAELIAADMAANGGYVSLEDLNNYKSIDGRYVTTSYRGYQVHGMAAPAGGGLVVKTLNMLENFELGAFTHAQYAAIMNQAIALSFQTMATDYQENDLALVQSKAWAKEEAQKIKIPTEGLAFLSNDLTPQTLLASNTDWTGSAWPKDNHHTTHFVTADNKGMVVSITQTLGPLFGSKVISPELGFVYASTMGTYLSSADQSPGSRPRTTIAPTVVTKDGEVVMVLGAAGGTRILSGIVQTISHYIDRNMTLEEAVSAPRVHPESGFDPKTQSFAIYPNKIGAEFTPKNGWSSADSTFWANNGFEVKPIKRYGAFSRIHAIAKDPKTGEWIGMADLDWEGTAAGVKK